MKVILNSSIIDIYTPYIAQIKEVREIVRYYQHSFAKKFKKCIADGRDLGSTVFPNATIKFFITADISIRARRRNTTVEKLKDRDYMDSHRSESPMRKSNDSIIIDTLHSNPPSRRGSARCAPVPRWRRIPCRSGALSLHASDRKCGAH